MVINKYILNTETGPTNKKYLLSAVGGTAKFDMDDGYAVGPAADVFAAVKQQWQLLGDADERTMGDREIVLAAVEQDGHALELVGEEMKADREIVLAVVKGVPRGT